MIQNKLVVFVLIDYNSVFHLPMSVISRLGYLNGHLISL